MPYDEAELRRHRETIVNRILVVIAVLAIPTYLLNVTLALRNGDRFIAAVDTVAVVAIIAISLLRHRLPLGLKAWSLPVLCYLIGMLLQVLYGPVVGGWTWMATFPVMAAVLIGHRAALLALGITAASLVAIGLALRAGMLDWPTTAPDHMTGWLAASVNFLVLSSIMALSVDALLTGLREETRMRRHLEGERARLALAVEQAPDMVVITGPDDRITYTNPAFTRVTGWPAGEVTGQTPGSLGLLGTDAAPAEWGDGTAAWSGSTRISRRDGAVLEVDVTRAPLRNAQGEVTHHVLTLRDMTREAELGRQLQQTQRLEAIGTLAGGIAHDFNNLLLPILANADHAARELPEEHPARRPMEDVAHSARRARELVRRILTFSRQGGPDRRPVDLVPLVREAAQLLRSTIPASYAVEMEDPGTPLVIDANDSELHQVLMNLGTNAWHAMREAASGTLTLRVGLAAPTDERLAHRGLGGRWARLEVADTGTGMTPEVRARAFDPFFTTKSVGEGTGLGLATVHGIVMDMGGVLVVESAPGQGTTMSLYFRLSGALPITAPQAAPALAGHGRRILAVDDEPLVLRALERLGARLGHRIETVTDPREALARLSAAPDEFDLLFTDLTMPGLTGVDLARAARRIRPELPVVMATGYLESETQASAEAAGIRHVIVKPFALAELDDILRRALGHHGDEAGHGRPA